MNAEELKTAVEALSIQKDLDKNAIVDVLVSTFQSELADYFNVNDRDVLFELDKEFQSVAFLLKDVVEDDEDADEILEINLEQARRYDKNATIGKKVRVPIDFSTLDRRHIRNLNSVLVQKLRNIHNEVLFREYKAKEGQLIHGTLIRRSGRDFFIDIGKTEAKLPWREQSPREIASLRQGDKVKCLLKEVLLDENSRLSIILSRRDPNFVKRLFEIEVPEIADGVVKIRAIVREAGTKTKMSVFATKTGVEPVGACVGLSGIRIKAVIKELYGEKIDVIPFGADLKIFLSRAMQPAKVTRILVIQDTEEEKEALVVVDDESFPLAIGKGGVNIKLAQALTGWRIKLKTDSQIAKNPEIIQIFSKAEEIFSNSVESDLHQLTEIPEELIVRLMNAGILSIAELYSKNVHELARIPGLTDDEAKLIRKTLDEQVEIVEDEKDLAARREQYMAEFEDELSGVSTDEEIKEEIQQVEYLVCPSCSFEFEYKNQTHCPSCGVEFEFEEREELV
ncbi:MAG: transcription termination factor NusA [Spirochaetes bacterium]|nr:transcription termination factor NusA [Spirochaetota bacterium]